MIFSVLRKLKIFIVLLVAIVIIAALAFFFFFKKGKEEPPAAVVVSFNEGTLEGKTPWISFEGVVPKEESFFKGSLSNVHTLRLTYDDVLGVIAYGYQAWSQAQHDPEEKTRVMRRVVNILHYNDFLENCAKSGDTETVKKFLWLCLTCLDFLADCDDGERSLYVLKKCVFQRVGSGWERAFCDRSVPVFQAIAMAVEMNGNLNTPVFLKFRKDLGVDDRLIDPKFAAEQALLRLGDSERGRELAEFVKN